MKIFLSCVSSEFKSYRLKLANQLEAVKGQSYDVKVQEDFQQGGFTLLERLADYIRDCDVVIHLAGDACGACPTPDHVQALSRRLGEAPSTPLPDLSYTQWEYELARRFGRRTLIYLPTPDAPRDGGLPVGQSDADACRQQAHIARMDATGAMRKTFAGQVPLVREVFYDLGLNPEECKVDNLPFKSIGSLFKGRDDFLRQIHDALGGVQQRGHHRAAAITASATAAAVHGLGGIGKTRAAIEYAQRHRDEYNALLFVRADSPSGLQSNLAALCGSAVLNLAEKDERDMEAQVGAVLRWLQRHPGWFLILDNVDTEEAAKAVEELLARLSEAGHVLVTSRLGNWSSAVESLALDVLSEAEASAFLLERTDEGRRKGADDSAQARQVAVELGQLALALEQAGAYIVRNRLTFAQYRDEWTKRHDRVLEWFDERLMRYPASVAVTWQTTFDHLSEPARQLLRLFAWLAPDPIPETLLDTPLPDAGPDEASPRDALADLDAYSLVTRDDEAPVFFVHRLVQDVTRRGLRSDTENKVLNRARNWINAAFPGGSDPGTWPVQKSLAAHAAAVTDHANDCGIVDETTFGLGLNLAGYIGSVKSDYAGCERLLRRLSADSERAFGTEEPLTLFILTMLAGTLLKEGDLAGAEPFCRRALEISERDSGPAELGTLASINNLSSLSFEKGDIAGAEALIRPALDACERVFGPEHPMTLSLLSNLAKALSTQGDVAGAELLYRRVLEASERVFGPEHAITLTTTSSWADVLRQKGDLAGAEPLYRRVLEACERVLGPGNSTTLASMGNLAVLLYSKGDFAGAESLYRRALESSEMSRGPDHPRTLLLIQNLALALEGKGDLAAAESLYERALRGFLLVNHQIGRDHPYYQGCVNCYLRCLQKMGRHGEAGVYRVIGDKVVELGLLVPEVNDADASRFLTAEDFLRESLAGHDRSQDAEGDDVDSRQAAGMTALQSRDMAFDLYTQGKHAEAGQRLRALLAAGFEIPGTCCHLARIALLTDDLPAAREHLAVAWTHRSEAPPYVVPRMLWLQLAARMEQDGDQQEKVLGMLKTALQTEGAIMEWTMDPVLAHLKGRMQTSEAGSQNWRLLCALVAAVSNRDQLPALDAFPAWREAVAQPLV